MDGGSPENRLGLRYGAAPAEHAEPTQQTALAGVEQLVAPADRRSQLLLARGQITGTVRQQLEWFVEPLEKLLGGQKLDPDRRQLNREWERVNRSADLGDDGRVVGCEAKVRARGLSPPNEQLHCGRSRDRLVIVSKLGCGKVEWTNREFVLAGNSQACATR